MATLTDSHLLVALVQTATALPIVLLALPAGAMADNLDRRRILIFAQVGMCLVSAALALTAFAGLDNPWLLLLFTFLIGCGGALFNPAFQASMGDLVPRADLPAAVTLNSMGFNMMRSVGPAIGGLIVSVAGAATAFAVNAASYLGLIAMLIRWRPAYPARTTPPEHLVAAILAGMRYVTMSPILLRILGRCVLFGLSVAAVQALLPSLAEDRFTGNAVIYGTMLGAFGLGAIVGGWSNTRLRARYANETIVRLACAAFALGCIGLAVSDSVAVNHLALLPAGAAWVLALSMFNVSVQLASPRWVLGRCLSIYQMATFGAMAAGSWLWGSLADRLSTEASLLCAAGGLALAALAGLIWRFPQFSTDDLSPIDGWTRPALRLDLTPRSGPIRVTVTYRIDAADEATFRTLMRERRRIRIRDGARHWALAQDIEEPDLWTEHYIVPTWTEYLRHRDRRTRTDLANVEALHALHRGSAAPEVHRVIERPPVPGRSVHLPRTTEPH